MPLESNGISDDAALERARAAVHSLYAADLASQTLGIEIVDAAPGRACVAMTVRSDMVNGWGLCHGGMLFTLADSAFAFACNSHGDVMVGAGASIEFLAPASIGERLTAVAQEISRSGGRGIYDVVVSRSSGEPIAHFRGRCARFRGAAVRSNPGPNLNE